MSREPEPSTASARLRGRDIVCIGFADWDAELWTNQQHLMSRLARDNRVLFVESLGLRQPQLVSRDLRRITRRLRRGLSGPRMRDGVDVVSPLVVPMHRYAAIRAVNRPLLRRLIRQVTRRLGFRQPILWAYVPQAEVLLDVLAPSVVVYHCVDDIAAQPGIDAASFRAAEQRFAARADLVLATTPALGRRLRASATNVVDAPNVADIESFARALDPGPTDPALDSLPTPRIVFTGAVVETKVDFSLLCALARLRPSWSFVLVGPIGLGDPTTDVSPLAAEPNIHLLGPRRHEDLPTLLRGADAGLIPYARNDLTASIFPMKVYEYLAAGLPVVATELPALADVPEVMTAPDAKGIATLLDYALVSTTEDVRLRRSRAVSAHSWERRLEEIARAIDGLNRGGA
jgi:glycosyltransferase involved in cell wall biosynthesis